PSPAKPKSRGASAKPESALLPRPRRVAGRRSLRKGRRNLAAGPGRNRPAMATGKRRESSRIFRVIGQNLDWGPDRVHISGHGVTHVHPDRIDAQSGDAEIPTRP